MLRRLHCECSNPLIQGLSSSLTWWVCLLSPNRSNWMRGGAKSFAFLQNENAPGGKLRDPAIFESCWQPFLVRTFVTGKDDYKIITMSFYHKYQAIVCLLFSMLSKFSYAWMFWKSNTMITLKEPETKEVCISNSITFVCPMVFT